MFVYRVDKSWIPNPDNPIKIASVGTRDTLEVAVLEGLEERVISIDCKKHRFHKEPFTESVSSLPSQDRDEIERVMVSGVSKKAINFILETLGEINAREAAEREESRRQKKKQAETILKPRPPEGGTSKPRTPRPPKGSQKSADIERGHEAKISKIVPAPKVPFSAPVSPVTNPPREPSGPRRQPVPKRTQSPEKKAKKQKTKTPDVAEETPLVLTQAEKGRVIAHGEEPSLEEAAADRKKFRQLFGHLYPFGVEAVFHVNIKQMTRAKSYQVTRPLDDVGVALMKNYLIQTPPAWPHHNLCLMPKLNKGESWREGMTWDDIKNGTFVIINGQHSVAASRQIVSHKDTEPSLREKLKVWPCTIVWTDDPSMTVRLSYTLNNSNSFNKFTPTWTTQIMYCRRVWVKLGRPDKHRVNAAVSDPNMAQAWKVKITFQT